MLDSRISDLYFRRNVIVIILLKFRNRHKTTVCKFKIFKVLSIFKIYLVTFYKKVAFYMIFTRVTRWLSQNFKIADMWPFGLEGLWLRYAGLQILILAFSWIALPTIQPCAIQGKEGIKFCHLATLTSG